MGPLFTTDNIPGSFIHITAAKFKFTKYQHEPGMRKEARENWKFYEVKIESLKNLYIFIVINQDKLRLKEVEYYFTT